MQSNTKTTTNKAFTLIEILVVIAIILVLAALLFPVFQAAKDSANETTSRSNLHQLHIALTQYAADNSDQIAMATDFFEIIWYKDIGHFGWEPGELHHPSLRKEDAGSFFARSIGYAMNSRLMGKTLSSINSNTVLACEAAPFGFTTRAGGIQGFTILATSLPDTELAKQVEIEYGIKPTPYPGKYFATGWKGKGLYLSTDGAVIKKAPLQIGFIKNEKPDQLSF